LESSPGLEDAGACTAAVNGDGDDMARALEEGLARLPPRTTFVSTAPKGASAAATLPAGAAANAATAAAAAGAVVIGRSTAVAIPGCGHTLFAECTYSWLKTNITSGKLSGAAMRCPLANVPSTSGGHASLPPPTPQANRGGQSGAGRRRRGGGSGGVDSGGSGLGNSDAGAARELAPHEVEGLIVWTAGVGEAVDLEASERAASVAAAARHRATRAAAQAAAVAEAARVEARAVAAKQRRAEADADWAVARAHVTCPEGHVLAGFHTAHFGFSCDGADHIAGPGRVNGSGGRSGSGAPTSSGGNRGDGGSHGSNSARLPRGFRLYGCRSCDFDLCCECALAQVLVNFYCLLGSLFSFSLSRD
jgi:uncharacterized membrane protein YgcG